MTTLRTAVLAISLALVLVACSQDADVLHAVAPDESAILATVNDEPIRESLLQAWARARGADLDQAQVRATAIRELADYLLLAAEARRQGFAADADFVAAVELARLQAVAGAAVQAMRGQAQIDASAIEHEYQRRIGQAGPLQYDFSQMVFADEDSALAAVAELLDGQTFAQVQSAFAGQAQMVRSHHGVSRLQLPPPLADALQTMSAGDTSPVPVRTGMGWHVFRLDAASTLQPPPLAELSDGIRDSLRAQLVQTRLEQLRDNARVVMDESAATGLASGADARLPAGVGDD